MLGMLGYNSNTKTEDESHRDENVKMDMQIYENEQNKK